MLNVRKLFGEKRNKQWVCTVCGYNIVATKADRCPFCGARSDKILDAATVSRRYSVAAKEVTPGIAQLKSSPRLGLEHAAYRIEADGGSVWIDCPATFRRELEPVDAILFTHKDFIGAANQYKECWGSEVWLHAADAEISQVSRHCVDKAFTEDFELYGVRGIHIGGHSPGFTVYVWRDTLFVCDYVYPPDDGMKLNPHGNRDATREGAGRLADLVSTQSFARVCGYNYTVDFAGWRDAFLRLV